MDDVYEVLGSVHFPVRGCDQDSVAIHRVRSGAERLDIPITRIRELARILPDIKEMYIRASPRHSGAVDRFLRNQMQHLEALRIDATPYDDKTAPVFTLPSINFPMLYMLVVQEGFLHIEPPMYGQLRFLAFERSESGTGKVPLAYFLHLLRNCPRLEHVYVESYLDVQAPPGTPALEPVNLANLRNLREFSLTDQTKILSRILSHVVIPKHVDVIVKVLLELSYEEDQEEVPVEDPHAVFRAMLPDDRRKLEMLLAATDIGIRFLPKECLISATIDTSEAGLDLEIFLDNDAQVDNTIVHTMVQTMYIFENSPVTTFRLRCDLETVPVMSWARMFDRFPYIEALYVDVNPAQSPLKSLESLFAGLAVASGVRQGAVCPRLRHLHITGNIGDTSLRFVDMVSHLVSRRAWHGAPPLEVLKVDLRVDVWDARAEAYCQERLGPFVKCLKIFPPRT